MGNTESNVTSGVKKQADTSSIQIYKFVDLKGGGLLVDMMKRAAASKQYAELDHAIKTKVEPFLYNKGKGRLIPVAQLVLLRNKDRPKHKMLPQLKAMENPDDYDIDSDFTTVVNEDEKHASLTTIASPIGCLLCGPISDRLGRKIALLLINLPGIIGWILICSTTVESANVIAQLYAGRVLLGLAVGMSSVPATVYLAEIASSKKLRSLLMPWTSISITLGILIVYVLGAIFRNNWRLVAACCGTLPVVSVIMILIFLPESPLWLVSKNKQDAAFQSLKILRGAKKGKEPPSNVRSEFDNMVMACKEKEAPKGEASTLSPPAKEYERSWRETLAAFRRPESIKSLFIMNGLFIFQQLSGYIVITYYSVDLLLKAGVEVDPFLATILLGLVQFLSGVAVSFVLTRFGRRPMNIAGGTGLALCMFGLGVNMQFGWFSSWFPLLALTALVVFSMVGFRTIPWTILGEIYPLDIKGVAVGMTTCTIYIFSFITVKLYPLLVNIFNSTEAIFYFYGVSSALGTLFVVVFQPETHNKTLDEIQEELKHGKKKVGGTTTASLTA